jgi:hypothetical protein
VATALEFHQASPFPLTLASFLDRNLKRAHAVIYVTVTTRLGRIIAWRVLAIALQNRIGTATTPFSECEPFLPERAGSSTLVTELFSCAFHRFSAPNERRFVYVRWRYIAQCNSLFAALRSCAGTCLDRGCRFGGRYAGDATARDPRKLPMQLRPAGTWRMHQSVPVAAPRIAMGSSYLRQAAHQNITRVARRGPALFAF